MTSTAANMQRVERRCPVCDAPAMWRVLRVGSAPAHVGVLWRDRDAALACPRGAIDLAFCRTCGFIGNIAFEEPRVTYREGYDNALDFSPVFQSYASTLAAGLVSRYELAGKSVLEIGCGMGEFLRLMHSLGVARCVGFDPSAPESGGDVALIRDTYSSHYADVDADLIICRQVFEHIADPRDFLRSLHDVIGERTIPVFFEVPNVRNIVEALSVWDIIYEHCSYFGAESLAYVFARCGFHVVGIDALYEDQFIGLHALPGAPADDDVPKGDVADLSARVDDFARTFNERIADWERRLDALRAAQKCAVVWGAGARGTSFVNMLDAGDVVRYLVDINPRKHGKHIPGRGQEIVSPDRLRDIRPDLVVVMNPVYMEEIRESVRSLGLGAEVVAA